MTCGEGKTHMKQHFVRMTFSLAALALISGCAMGPELTVPIAKTSNDRFTIRWAHAYQGKRGVEIWGLVSRRGYGARGGHIHVEALGSSGSVLGQADARLPMMGVRHRSGSFGTRLQVADVTDIAKITVQVKATPDA